MGECLTVESDVNILLIIQQRFAGREQYVSN